MGRIFQCNRRTLLPGGGKRSPQRGRKTTEKSVQKSAAPGSLVEHVRLQQRWTLEEFARPEHGMHDHGKLARYCKQRLA